MELPPLIKALLDPRAYPENPEEVRLCQTHISYLFFTPNFVYKIKKPVNFGFLDFTSLDKRKHFCEEEVRLNRRLAPSVYIGVVRIISPGRTPFVGVDGEAVEYAVKMARLPEESILVRALKAGAVKKETILRIARAVAEFHKKALTNPYISGFGSPDVIRKNTDENFIQTRDFINKTISNERRKAIKDYTDSFLDNNKGLFLKRVNEGFIKDCHGDIHCEHISILDGINIFDCIEFNERFRYSDTVADAAFLSMDLDYQNRHDLTKALDEGYLREASDKDGGFLLDFYKCYRAYVRGKVEGFKFMEPEIAEDEKTLSLVNARYHFYLADLYSTGGFRPAMVIVSGLSGTGKSTLARRLSEAINLPRISSDSIRKGLAGLPLHEKRYEPFKKGIYSDEFTERTYAALIQEGAGLLLSGRSVILDATFLNPEHLERAKEAASKIPGAQCRIIECTAGADMVKERLHKRAMEEKPGGVASDGRWEVYLRQKELYKGITGEGLRVNTGRPIEESLPDAVRKIFG